VSLGMGMLRRALWRLPGTRPSFCKVMEILSEHCCEGWLEGYLLTGRHGLFPCYEALPSIVDSMINQHCKWLKATSELEWRKMQSSTLTCLQTSMPSRSLVATVWLRSIL